MATFVCISSLTQLHSLAASPNGWTDRELAISWIVDDFDALTKAKASGHTCLLLLDGHCSHYTPELLRHAQEANIVILAYPPHCTHALQTLDVVYYVVMKQYWAEEVEKFEEVNKHQVSKEDLPGVFVAAYTWAFTEDTIHVAFCSTRVHLFNAYIISPQQMAPSLTSSIVSSFPCHRPAWCTFKLPVSHSHPGPIRQSGIPTLAPVYIHHLKGQVPSLLPSLAHPAPSSPHPLQSGQCFESHAICIT